MKTKLFWLAFVLLVLSGCTMHIDPLHLAPTATPAPTTASSIASPTAETRGTPSPSPVTDKSEESMVVCTGYDKGALNLRACPGVQCYALATVYEGQEVRVSSRSPQTSGDGATWLYVTAPIEGWANARYLCGKGIQR